MLTQQFLQRAHCTIMLLNEVNCTVKKLLLISRKHKSLECWCNKLSVFYYWPLKKAFLSCSTLQCNVETWEKMQVLYMWGGREARQVYNMYSRLACVQMHQKCIFVPRHLSMIVVSWPTHTLIFETHQFR